MSILGVTTENGYGRGGKQLVYGDNQFLYLDLDGKVTDWQNTRCSQTSNSWSNYLSPPRNRITLTSSTTDY
jgi:hypothetical protein